MWRWPGRCCYMKFISNKEPKGGHGDGAQSIDLQGPPILKSYNKNLIIKKKNRNSSFPPLNTSPSSLIILTEIDLCE